MFGHKLKHTHITVRREYDRSLPAVRVYGSEINQVWTNLLDNAIDAVGEEGQITLSTQQDRECVRVDVSDSVPGIPPEVARRVFEPSFTTKDAGRGTGLGLDTSRRIVEERHPGSLTFETSRQGRPFTSGFRWNNPNRAGENAMSPCTHLESIAITDLPASVEGCEDCLREGGVWLHLRICLGCGHVGCCDDSPARHATAHFQQSEHPLMRSLEPGEDWVWCFRDELAMRIPEIRGQTHIPPSPMLS